MEITKHRAEEGKVWRSKIDGQYLSVTLILGAGDKLSNYEQVDPPPEPEDDPDGIPA